MYEKRRVRPQRANRLFDMTPYLLLTPCFLIFGLFVFYPFFNNILYSLSLTQANGAISKYVGLKNYLRVLTSQNFWSSITVTLKFALIVGTFSFGIGVLLALAATTRRRGSRIYETMYAMPLVIAAAPAACIWYLFFQQAGLINYLFGTNARWLAQGSTALYCVAAVTVWANLGMNVIFLITGFRNVPQDLMESAELDGAGYLSRVFNVLVPIASPQIFFVVFFNIALSFTTFAQIRLLTDGGPYYTTNTLIYSIYVDAFRSSRFDQACAKSVMLFLVIFALTRIQFLFEERSVNYR